MKKLILALLMLPITAHADTCATVLGNAFTFAQQNALCGKFGSIGGPLRQSEVFGGVGQQVAYATPPAVITPSTTYPTPNAGDTLSMKFSLIAAGAPTASYVELPKATAIVGYFTSFGFWNPSANPVAVVPIQGDSINALAAGTPYPVSAGKKGSCDKVSNTLWVCTGT